MDQLKQTQTYYQDSYLFKHASSILQVEQNKWQDPKLKTESDVIRLLLQENIFHPQGGGQPDDEGSIEVNNAVVAINQIINDKQNGRVYLDLTFEKQLLEDLKLAQQNNMKITQLVNEEKRRLYARLHSGGHFLDIATKKVGLNWLPSKGFHFAEGSYVEYVGTIEGKAEDIAQQLQKASNEIMNEIKQDDGKSVEYLDGEGLKNKLGELPEYLKDAQDVRYVQLCKTDKGCPCGGTHVNHIKEIGEILITKVQKKGKNVRVSYKLK